MIVRDILDLLHRDRVECERDLHLTAVDPALQFAQPPDSSHEIDAWVSSQILYAQYLVQDILGQYAYIQAFHQIGPVIGVRTGFKLVPLPFEVHRESVKFARSIN